MMRMFLSHISRNQRIHSYDKLHTDRRSVKRSGCSFFLLNTRFSCKLRDRTIITSIPLIVRELTLLSQSCAFGGSFLTRSRHRDWNRCGIHVTSALIVSWLTRYRLLFVKFPTQISELLVGWFGSAFAAAPVEATTETAATATSTAGQYKSTKD